ncbi:mitotic checkpoint protein BUB3.3 isoform X2 [Elaeis guineensis]|uniref:Mitotic checkpoint protein BUB3.3 isoform X2 n=1 Tax=Elaeis guineensis var. tenera TaxID=51953 RepID=A0A6J0PSF4_ELAGV|nr:mitotic checkpoint protein BUB3.3 isoform X2 [Elaeis guineensis]
MEGSLLELGEPIGDAISRIRFAPRSNNLLISSWDSVLRLYDVDGSERRLEAPSEAALLDCCFQDEKSALSAGSDGCIRRYNLCSGAQDVVGKHDDSAICIEYSEETGLDKTLMFWDMHMENANIGYTRKGDSDIWSMSLCGFYLLAAVGIAVKVYDLRNLKGPVLSKESSVDFHVKCVRSFSSNQGYAVGSIDGCVALKYFDPPKECEMGCVFRCHPKSKNGRYHLVAVNDIGFHPRYDTFVTGDDDGYAIIWDAQSRKKVFELQRYPSSVASLSYNYSGQFLAVASSYTFQEANEVEEAPHVYLHKLDNFARPSSSDKI